MWLLLIWSAATSTPPASTACWGADLIQFRTEEGWLYLAIVVDLYSRRVVGWAMAVSPTTDLVIDALLMAFERRRPDPRVVHHSDRVNLVCTPRWPFAPTGQVSALPSRSDRRATATNNAAVEPSGPGSSGS